MAFSGIAQKEMRMAQSIHPHIQRPSNGILLIATDMTDETMNDDAAVAMIAYGADSLSWNIPKNGDRTNM